MLIFLIVRAIIYVHLVEVGAKMITALLAIWRRAAYIKLLLFQPLILKDRMMKFIVKHVTKREEINMTCMYYLVQNVEGLVGTRVTS